MSAPPALRTPSTPSPSLPWSRVRTALRRLWLPLVVALVAVTGGAVTGAGPAAAAGTATFTPGAAWQDTGGNALQLHGLGIVKAGSTWYGFGENKAGESSSNAAFQSVACYSSADLAHWTRQNDALTRQSSGDLGPNRVVERPKVLFNASTGTYVMYLHIDSSSYGEAKVGVATSSTPCGPYSYRGSFQPLGQQSRDIGLFQDTDGSAYLLTEDRANGLRIDRLSADYLSVTSSVHVFGDYEAPAMVKADGRYYLFGSSLTGWSTNDNVYATATSLTGTWSAFRPVAPVGTHTYNSQTANVIPVAGSGGTAYVFAADRWTTSDLGSSPEVWLPLTLGGGTAAVSWQNSWTLDTAAGTWTGTSNPADGTYRITAASSGKRLDVKDAATADGSAVEQWSANSGTNQQWTLHRVAGSTYTVTGVGSGKQLDVPGGSTAAGTRLDIRGADGAADQRWVLQAAGGYTSPSGSSYVLVNLGSGLVADVAGGSTADGALVEQWDANGGSNQTWSLG
ncbi:RICIN domain-containing protein [Streptomyces sp. NRRL F-5123]|uniref:RICIN domain-containing protein n=1 Tax=Streptomyces sp. NRRL F-5123 TaxID=1463856 RepID=UPI00099DB519|nr:RICIN domain-containing protein [Streptomyces sp. NRRL F-5123]